MARRLSRIRCWPTRTLRCRGYEGSSGNIPDLVRSGTPWRFQAHASRARIRVSARVPWKVMWVRIAFALAAVLLYFSLRGIDWRGVWTLFQAAKSRYLAIACAIMTLGLFLRSARWRI